MKKVKKNSELSFFARAILFFRYAKEWLDEIKPIERVVTKQKKLAMYEGSHSPENTRISYYFGISKVITLGLLVRLISFAVILGSIISYGDVYYMFKDIGYINSFGESRPGSLNYSKPVENQDFTVFKDGLAVVSDSEIKFFTSTGRATLTLGSEYTNPKISCSESTALIYDQGRKSFSVYNSFVSLYSEQLDSPISSADMSDNGAFLLVTESAKYRSLVKFYNNEFELTHEYSKNDHVISAKMSKNGRYAAVLSMAAKGGESETYLNVIDCRKSNVISAASFGGHMPYFCEFTEDDRIALFFTDSVYVVDLNGKTQNEYKYPSPLRYASVYKDRFMLVFEESGLSSGSTAAAFDKKGELIYLDVIGGTIKDVAIDGDNIYVLKERELVRISTSTGAEVVKQIIGDDAQLVVLSGGRAAICSSGVAHFISFN